MRTRKFPAILALLLIAALVLAPFTAPVVHAVEEIPTLTDGPVAQPPDPATSHRLIVELESPPLAVAFQSDVQAAGVNGKLDAQSAAAQAYVAQLQAEQAAFVNTMQAALPGSTVSTFRNETGAAEQATYQLVFNGVSVDPGALAPDLARAQLEKMPGVKAVYADRAYTTQLYTSTQLINAPIAWNSSLIGGQERAGAGIKIASMDSGVHKDAPMMDGTGYSYPPGFGPTGLGLTENNNGKIIASRVYFRTWDPPAPGDENPWPGENGSSHGIHTASTAAGDVVDDVEYLGYDVGTMSGVAPKAHVMSYRVFYASVNGIGSFYTTEGLAALEDIVADGADVVNNSWGGGPTGEGGEFDPLDQALINASRAGVFVAMSAGNAGPGLGTVDHPSPDYISVAASTTSGTLAAGRLGVAGEPTIQDIAFGTADFGPPLPIGTVTSYPYVTAGSVDPANVTGCEPFPANAFDGVAALISRGGCFFSDKVYNAQQAGATFAVVYNNTGGDEILNMSCGSFCGPGEITIPSIFVGENDGNDLVAYYDANSASNPELELNTLAFQAGSTPDRIIDFSSRGPGVGMALKPDIAAPGVNILAQGYAPGVTGEDRHLGYGQASGTSMAAPHVAGAAALLKQAHPTWSNAAIKSALMSTAKYMDIYTADGAPAQPLDMGAGRLDIAAALDPGVILDPPSLSFGMVPTGTQRTLAVQVTSVADSTETYSLSTLYTGNSFTQTTSLPGFGTNVASVTLAPGETSTISVTLDTADSAGYGDNQGYILMESDGHSAHMPAWARIGYAQELADVLIIDNDFSDELGNPDYLWYYTSALDELGYSYSVVSTADGVGQPATIPDATTLAAYKAVIWFTGDHYQPDGTFSVSTGLTELDQDRLTEYLNGGGVLLAMGQDLAAVLGAAEFDAEPSSRNFLYVYRLGANWVQDSISNLETPQNMIVDAAEAPAAFADVIVDLTRTRKYAAGGALSGANEVPPVATGTTGEFQIAYDVDQRLLAFALTVVPTTTNPITVTGAHIHEGAVGVNGPVLYNLAEADPAITLPRYVTDSLTIQGAFTLTSSSHVTTMLENGLYINVHTTANPAGEARAQIEPVPVPNQPYVDEIDNVFHDGSQDPNPDPATTDSLPSTPLLRYLGINNIFEGTVAMAHRDQPSLERPGIDYRGRSVYTAFGLEGMYNGNPDAVTRAELLDLALDWAWSEPAEVLITDITPENSSELTILSVGLYAEMEDGGTAILPPENIVSVRWDFGDGSPIMGPFTSLEAGYQYPMCRTYTVRAEVTDIYGNVSIGSTTLDITENCAPGGQSSSGQLFLPFIESNNP